jgi:REP element-mobilizing transposase RayT
MASSTYFTRKKLPHDVPPWVPDGEIFFLTLCAKHRETRPLVQPRVPEQLLQAATHYHESGRWLVRLFLVMPDHVHALVAMPPGSPLRKTVAAWKSYTAKATGISWQSDFFDHRPRNSAALYEKEEYIRQNPVRCGLVKSFTAWPWFLDESACQHTVGRGVLDPSRGLGKF